MHDDLHSVGPLAVIVMGVSGSGKSTLGTALAAAIDCPFMDRLRAAIAAPVDFVLMDASPGELLRRLTTRKHHYMPPSLLTSQLDTPERPQADEPAIALDATLPVAILCEQAIAWLLKRFR